MTAQPPFCIEQFYSFMNEGKLMAGKCRKCGKIHLPPRPLCDRCLSKDFEWTSLPTTGKLLAYTIIHVAPLQFQASAPYIIGVIGFDNGLKIPGMIKHISPEQIKIRMSLSMAFEPCSLPMRWPQWPTYHFKPV
jgi:uncharacterized OB-fold protein